MVIWLGKYLVFISTTVAMETAMLSETVPTRKSIRLPDEKLGFLYRRFKEMISRIEKGVLEYKATADELQKVIEGRILPETVHLRTAQPEAFKRPPTVDRERSRGGWERRLPHARNRLNWPDRCPERIIAEIWEAECIPDHRGENALLDQVFEEEAYSERDAQVVNSTIQWLGTAAGQGFLRKFLGVSQIMI